MKIYLLSKGIYNIFGRAYWFYCPFNGWTELIIFVIHFSHSYFQPEDSNSRVVGTGDELLVDDTTDSLSSVLRKEIEGKVITSNPKSHLAGFKSNESLGDSFEDAKEELVSNSSMGSLHKGPTHTGKNKDTMQSMEVDLKLASRKRKPVDMDDTSAPPKHGR